MDNSTEETKPIDRRNEKWHDKWRKYMAWQYMFVCIIDFVVFPVLWSILQAYAHGTVTSQWNPTTLGSGGLYHVAMGAILGVSAFVKK